MNLYRTATGAWAGTQADAGKGFTAVEVPTDKAGLIAWLNAREFIPSPPVRYAPAPDMLAQLDKSAGATLSRIDCPDADRIVAAIMAARGHVLKRFAGAVALAFGALS